MAARPGRLTLMMRGSSIRARILAAYLVLLVAFSALFLAIVHRVQMLRIDQRMDSQLSQEVLEFNRLVVAGRDPETGLAFTSAHVLFDVFFQQNVPSDDEALAGLIDGQVYRSALVRFPLERLPEEVSSRRFTSATDVPTEGTASGTFASGLGTGRYRSVTVTVGSQTGTFVVAILPAEELSELGDLTRTGIWTAGGLLLVATMAAWFIAGRVLAPVRGLTETARLISDSDLTRRIPTTGIGETVEMARSFNGMLDRLEIVLRGERDFIRDASHELRVPLTITLGNLQLLGGSPKERRHTLELVTDELERMGRIVDDLQLLAEVAHSDFIQPEQIDVNPMTRELLAKAEALAARRWTLDAVAGGVVWADRHRLTEAVMNLAQNATQHTTEGDVIGIGTTVRDGELLVSVRDVGAGVPVSDQARIFDRFRRGSRAHRTYRGSGLGLAIVKKIAEAHGGRVMLDSQVGRGATFTIVLPMKSDKEARRVANPHR